MHIEKRKNKHFDFPKYFDDEATRLKFDLGLRNIAFPGMPLPPVNMDEEEGGYVIQLVAPGMKPDDFQVELSNDILTISANMPNSNNSKRRIRRREFNYKAFQRTLRLPTNIDSKSGVEAYYENGVLQIIIQKAA